MAKKLVGVYDTNCIEFWLVDKSLEYLDVVKKSKDLIEIHCGIDEGLSYMPVDDATFLDNIKSSLGKVEELLIDCKK